MKVGTSSVTRANGDLDDAALAKLCADIATARDAGHPVVLVLSGAVAAGHARARTSRARPTDTGTLQAIAAVGQPRLFAHASRRCSQTHGIVAGQVLLTPNDFMQRSQYLHARETLHRLLDMRVLPVVNENDTIADDEIRYGDNDRLAALVSHLLGARTLLLAHRHRRPLHRRSRASTPARRSSRRSSRSTPRSRRSPARAAASPAAAAWRASSRPGRSPRGRACAP